MFHLLTQNGFYIIIILHYFIECCYCFVWSFTETKQVLFILILLSLVIIVLFLIHLFYIIVTLYNINAWTKNEQYIFIAFINLC